MAATTNPNVQGVVGGEGADVRGGLQAGRGDEGAEGGFAAGTWGGVGGEEVGAGKGAVA